MQNKLVLYTKKDCVACENVKSFLSGFHVPQGLLEIKDITNDLVMINNLKEGVPGLEDGVETKFTAMSFPSLQVIDLPTLTTVGLITPSQKIIEFLTLLNFPAVEKVEDKPTEEVVN